VTGVPVRSSGDIELNWLGYSGGHVPISGIPPILLFPCLPRRSRIRSLPASREFRVPVSALFHPSQPVAANPALVCGVPRSSGEEFRWSSGGSSGDIELNWLGYSGGHVPISGIPPILLFPCLK
jgi:hypothetical protein